jgi:hypothetical protein
LCKATLSLRLGELPLRLLNLGFSLIDSGLKWTRVNLKENLILSDRRTLAVFLADQIPAHLRLYLRIDKAIEGTNPVAGQWDIALANFYY